jgi:hypothetical protein
MDEICPACGTVHQGFDPRPEQHHSFWQCRRCGVELTTMRMFTGWEVHGNALAASLYPDISKLREIHGMLRSFATFIHHRVLNDIEKLTLDSETLTEFRHGLMKLHKDYTHV